MPARFGRRTRRRIFKTGYRMFAPQAVQANLKATKALRLANYAKSRLNSEIQYFDHTTTKTPAAGSATFTNILQIPQGDGESTRHGNQVKLMSVYGRIRFRINPSASTTRVRVMMYQDKYACGGTNPTITDLLDTNDIDSFRNLDHTRRFRVLKEWYITLVQDQPNDVVWRKFFIKTHMKPRYESSATAAPEFNNIGFMFISNEATNTPTVELHTRVRYVDN